MPGIEAQHQLPIIEIHLDPLGEFLPEARTAAEPKRILQVEPAVAMSAEEAASNPFGVSRARRGRWVTGWVMLGLGLVSGFTVAIALAWHFYGNGRSSSPAPATAPSTVDRADDQGAPSLPATERPADAQSVAGTVDGARGEGSREAVNIPDAVARTSPSAVIATPAAAPDIVTPGLHVQSRPSGAAVYLDDQLVSTTPFHLLEIAPGTHTIRVVQPGYKEWSTSVNVEAGARTRISASLEQEQD